MNRPICHQRISLRLALTTIACAAFWAAPLALTGCAPKPMPPASVVAPVGSFIQAWRLPVTLKDDKIRSLSLLGETLYVYSEKNTVIAINAASGRAIYQRSIEADGIPLKPPVMVKDHVAFPTGDTIHILDANGKQTDVVQLDHAMRSGAASSGTAIYVGLDYPGGGRLAAIDLTRRFNRTRWELLTFAGLSAAPAVHANIVFAASEDGRVYAVGEDRLPVWPLENSAFDTGRKILADVKADDTGVYVASTDTKLYCLELGTGKIKWQYYSNVPLTRPVELTTTMAYLPVEGRGIVALAKNEGKYNREAKWVVPGATDFLAEDERYAYLLGSGGRIIGVEKTTGDIKFLSSQSGFTILAKNLNPKNNLILVATKEGTIFGIQPVTRPGSVGVLAEAPARESDLAMAN